MIEILMAIAILCFAFNTSSKKEVKETEVKETEKPTQKEVELFVKTDKGFIRLSEEDLRQIVLEKYEKNVIHRYSMNDLEREVYKVDDEKSLPLIEIKNDIFEEEWVSFSMADEQSAYSLSCYLRLMKVESKVIE
jgi:hypothetical protein